MFTLIQGSQVLVSLASSSRSGRVRGRGFSLAQLRRNKDESNYETKSSRLHPRPGRERRGRGFDPFAQWLARRIRGRDESNYIANVSR